MNTAIISSQHYIDDAIVAAKQAERDYTVTLSPEFEVGGVLVQVVLDGHHSLAAAKADGVDPDYTLADASTNDTVALIAVDPAKFLEAAWIDGDYYDVSTGASVW